MALGKRMEVAQERMNTRERILTTLNWGEPDRIPLTVYDWLLPLLGKYGISTAHIVEKARRLLNLQ